MRSCYHESLKIAKNLGCESVTFPLIATGVYGFPKDLAIRTATSVIYDFLMENDMMVYLVVFDRKAYDLSGKLFQDIHAYIDENYVSEQENDEYRIFDSPIREPELTRKRRQQEQCEENETALPESRDAIGEHLKQPDISFQEYLL